MPVQLIIRNPLDRDAREYIQRAGVTDAAARLQLNEFVRGVKALGLWDSMVCWPLREAQNSGGASTTAYSLGGLGTFNGTLVNGPTWGADALDFATDTSKLTTALQVAAAPVAAFFVHKSGQAQTNNNSVFFTGGINVNGRQFSASNSASPANQNYNGLAGTWYNAAFGVTNFGNGSRTSRDYVAYRVLSASAARISRNTTQSASDLAVSGWDSSSPGSVQFGFYPQEGSDSTLSFMAYISAAINNATDSAFYTLYRATLGTGLGLP